MPTPDRWLVLTAEVAPDDPLRDLIAEGLLALGGLSILEEREALTTYLAPPQKSAESYLKEASRFLAEWIADDPPQLRFTWQPNEDWEREWRKGLQPRKVSERFVVKPSWTDWPEDTGEIVIEIDPQMAFGTGEHPTTRGCLRLLDRVIEPGARVLDVGSGSGILSIASALAGARETIAVEFDPDANLNARENIERNGVEGRIELLEQMGDEELLRRLGTFDVVLANILSGVIRPLLPALAEAVAPAGRLIVSGILQEESRAVLADAEAAGLALESEDRDEEWWSAVLQPTKS